ncbi:MAG: hypothetical protein CMM02_07610 [Rhodopirellula sp.]|nr:hypothetical protein [Rhodopirellula sp.]
MRGSVGARTMGLDFLYLRLYIDASASKVCENSPPATEQMSYNPIDEAMIKAMEIAHLNDDIDDAQAPRLRGLYAAGIKPPRTLHEEQMDQQIKSLAFAMAEHLTMKVQEVENYIRVQKMSSRPADSPAARGPPVVPENTSPATRAAAAAASDEKLAMAMQEVEDLDSAIKASLRTAAQPADSPVARGPPMVRENDSPAARAAAARAEAFRNRGTQKGRQ